MKKGVLIIVENLPVPFDRRVWQEARALRDEGYSVYIICPKGKGSTERREVLEGIEIYRHSLPLEADSLFGYVGEYLWALTVEFILTLRICLTRRVDIIHACNPPDTIFVIGGFFKLFGKKFVFDHHDICPELFDAKFAKRGMAYKITRALERMTFRTADMSIATNDSYKEIAIKRGGMAPEKVFVVRSGPDLSRVKAVEPNDKWRSGRKYLIAYVGVIGKQEGLDLLIESMRTLVYDLQRNDIHLCVIGGGTELNSVIKLAEESNVSEYVTFTGRIADEELFEILSTADVCVNPDRVNDMNSKSTMNKVLEYMAMGKPIVQFEMIEGRVSAGTASLYAAANDENDFAKKIVQLLADSELREEMGRIGRSRIDDGLSWEHQKKNLIAAYDSLSP